MTKIYYKILEYSGDILKESYYFLYKNIMESKKAAEKFYISRLKENSGAMDDDPSAYYKLALMIIQDRKVSRYILNKKDSTAYLIESILLSELTGKPIEVPEWSIRKADLFTEFAGS